MVGEGIVLSRFCAGEGSICGNIVTVFTLSLSLVVFLIHDKQTRFVSLCFSTFSYHPAWQARASTAHYRQQEG
jgi:hypothetical protein